MKLLAKTFSYSIMHMIVAISVAYAISGDWVIAVSIGLIEPIVQTVFYFIHENAWDKISIFKNKNLKNA